MFVKRNRTALAGKQYGSVLLVQGKRVPGKRPPGRPPADAPAPKSVVVHETLANLSKLPEELIRLIERYCHGQCGPAGEPVPAGQPGPAPGQNIHVGPCYGVLAALHALARELGLVQAVGEAKRVARWRST